MSKKSVAVGLALMLVLAGCGHRARSASAADPSSTSPIATVSSSTPVAAPAASATSVPATSSRPVAAPILNLPTASSSSRPPAPTVPPVTAAQLLSAPVPSLCRHSPGRLVNGKLPGIPARHGVVQLASVDGYRNHDTMAAFGDLDGGGDAAVVMDCDQGGVTWPDELVFYGPGPKILGSFDMSAATDSTRVGVRGIAVSDDGTVTVNSTETLYNEGECCASGRATATLRWNGKKIVLVGVQHLPGPTTIGASQVGVVQLGMTAQQLDSLGYHSGIGPSGCLNYTAAGRPSVIFDPGSDRVLAITTTDQGAYRTYLGGLRVGDQLTPDRLSRYYPQYLLTSYLKHDFGQGKTGLTVTAPDGSGSIGFVLAAVPNAHGATITAIRVGKGLNATATEPSCH